MCEWEYEQLKKFFLFGFPSFLACDYPLQRRGLTPQWWQPSLGIKKNLGWFYVRYNTMLKYAKKNFTKLVLLRSVYTKRMFSKRLKFKFLISYGRIIALAYINQLNTFELTKYPKHDATMDVERFRYYPYSWHKIINK